MKIMPQSTQEERYRWIKLILENGLTIKEVMLESGLLEGQPEHPQKNNGHDRPAV